MHAAAATAQFDIVYKLLQAGADYTITDNFNTTLVYSIENNNINPQHEQYQWRAKVIEFLHGKRVKVNPRIP